MTYLAILVAVLLGVTGLAALVGLGLESSTASAPPDAVSRIVNLTANKHVPRDSRAATTAVTATQRLRLLAGSRPVTGLRRVRRAA